MTISLFFCLVAVVVLCACAVLMAIQYNRLLRENSMLREMLSNEEALNSELRMARHDYLNHLQVISGLVELEEYEDLANYVKPLCDNLMKTGKAIKTAKPAINALLKAKMEEAESRKIRFVLEVKSDLKALPMEDWQLCRVLSNLIDNAITALGESEEEKELEVDINENAKEILFEVSNNGPEIPKENLETIFKKGFTTKRESGHGMGLAIVAEIINNHKGTITVSSSKEKTAFRVILRKETQ